MKPPTGWKEEHNKITKTYTKKDFKEAITFTNNIAAKAEQADHHPDIKIHDYNKVTITLTTHDKGTVTDKDTKLAREIEDIP